MVVCLSLNFSIIKKSIQGKTRKKHKHMEAKQYVTK